MSSLLPVCNICLEEYEEDGPKVPRTLSKCGHTFCEGCLEKIFGKVGEGRIKCPNCNTVTAVSSTTDLFRAFELISHIQTLKQSMEPASSTTSTSSSTTSTASTASSTASTTASTASTIASTTASTTALTTASTTTVLEEKDAKECKLTLASVSRSSFQDVLLAMEPPKGSTSTSRSCDVCCVIDISGSMSTEATTQNDQNQVESHGLSLLDVVKHAVKTVIEMLKPVDRLAIVSFASTAHKVVDLTLMNDAGKKKVIEKLEALVPTDTTNLWAGLHSGLELLRQRSKGEVTSLFLFTDGQPNVAPPIGELRSLKKYQTEHPEFTCAINMFGFGYSLDSVLLSDLATQGNGSFGYISDGGMVGTVFVNAVSNLLSTFANDLTISITPSKDSKIVDIYGGYLTQETKDGTDVLLGPVQYGQTKYLVVSLKSEKDSVIIRARYRTRTKTISLEAVSIKEETSKVEIERQRLLVATSLAQIVKEPKRSRILIEEICKSLRRLKSKDADALLKDLEGQVTLACSRDDWWKRWGIAYLLSLSRAHLLQQCINFKDAGVQGYGGDLFRHFQEKGNDTFLKLPPPKPSLQKVGHTAAPVSMHSYYNACGGCFASGSMVHMMDGSKKTVDSLRKGDVVFDGHSSARVVCLVKMFCEQVSFSCVSKLRITPYHPINIEGVWAFPADVSEKQIVHEDCHVYNVVLDSGHILVVDDVLCATLGHGFHGKVIEHEYFGTQRVIKDLEKMTGWEAGFVELSAMSFNRDPVTNLVCGVYL